MENPGSRVVGPETDGDEVACCIANVDCVALDGVQKVETTVGTLDDGEWVLFPMR